MRSALTVVPDIALPGVAATANALVRPASGGIDAAVTWRTPGTADTASRAIVEQMKIDEAAHAELAEAAGARVLPEPLRLAMRLAARVMTGTAHHI